MVMLTSNAVTLVAWILFWGRQGWRILRGINGEFGQEAETVGSSPMVCYFSTRGMSRFLKALSLLSYRFLVAESTEDHSLIDLKKWAAEGLAYLTLDADVKVRWGLFMVVRVGLISLSVSETSTPC